jgi:histidinol phosphatase-like enzyme (inositol monophosphatase family)
MAKARSPAASPPPRPVPTFLDFAHHLADRSGETILRHFRRRRAVTNKAGGLHFDPVTIADRSAERVMREAIAQQYPDHGIVGEEFEAAPGIGRYHWILDPIDGTRAFISGNPLWGTLIALTDRGRPVLGLMNQPFTRERFWAWGRTAWMQGPEGRPRRLRTRACARLEDAVVTTTHPDLFADVHEHGRFGEIKSRARMTRFGGDCYGYCLLAMGCVDLVVEAGLKPYDVMALIPLIENAGGMITTWEGEPALNGGRVVAAGDARTHRQGLRLLAG